MAGFHAFSRDNRGYAGGLRKLSQWNLLELNGTMGNGQYVSMLSTLSALSKAKLKFSIPGCFETYFQSWQTQRHTSFFRISSPVENCFTDLLHDSCLDYLVLRHFVTWGCLKFKLHHAAKVYPQEASCIRSTEIFSIASSSRQNFAAHNGILAVSS